MKKYFGVLLLLTLISPNVSAAAQTIDQIANNIIQQIDDLPGLFGGLSYVFGIVLGIKGILKLKEHNESKGQVKLGIPIAMILASAMFLAFPTFVKTGTGTIFGADAKSGYQGLRY